MCFFPIGFEYNIIMACMNQLCQEAIQLTVLIDEQIVNSFEALLELVFFYCYHMEALQIKGTVLLLYSI